MPAICPSRSAPGALLMSTSKARCTCGGPWRETHTPSSLRGALVATKASPMRTASPVGSRSSSGLMALPAGVPNNDRLSAMASRKPAAVKRCASTPGLSW